MLDKSLVNPGAISIRKFMSKFTQSYSKLDPFKKVENFSPLFLNGLDYKRVFVNVL
jgi:hypothetical protein